MKVLKFFVFACLCLIVDKRCEGCVATSIRIAYPVGQEPRYLWSVGSPIEFSTNLTCDPRFFGAVRLNVGDVSTGVTVTTISVRRNETLRCENQAGIFLIIFCFQYGNGHYGIRTVLMANSRYDSLTLNVYSSKSSAVLHTPPLAIKNCTERDLPHDLMFNFTGAANISYHYREILVGSCRHGDAFINGSSYSENLKMYCGKYAQWEVPDYVCTAKSCPAFTHKILRTSTSETSAKKYRAGTRAQLECKHGHMYYTHKPSRFESGVRTVCQESGIWEHEEVDCWTGPIVDFTNTTIALQADLAAVLICKPQNKDSKNKVKMAIGQQSFADQEENVWRKIRIISKYHGTYAECTEIDNNGQEVQKRTTALHVLFAPELDEKAENGHFALLAGSAGNILVKFCANPTLRLSDIHITKNGAKIPNYYLLLDGVNHTVVVDFLKVDSNDFGKYTVGLASHPPFNGTTIYNITITGTQVVGAAKQLSVSEAVGVTLGVGLGVALVAVALFLAIKKLRHASGGTKKSNSVAMENEGKDPHNYEEIKESGATTQSHASSAFGGTHNRSNRAETGGGYEVPIGGASRSAVATAYEYDN